jgi:hypothetical protein
MRGPARATVPITTRVDPKIITRIRVALWTVHLSAVSNIATQQVLSIRGGAYMQRIYTAGIVTPEMVKAKPDWNWPNKQFVADAMSISRLVADPKRAITT